MITETNRDCSEKKWKFGFEKLAEEQIYNLSTPCFDFIQATCP
jgi:hypothetical protein